ncbi:unnamed protein product [Peniophora sp. CBMAI 1063]|nr:unnamed protein product [Peniophora sp. CBMAI 1063]
MSLGDTEGPVDINLPNLQLGDAKEQLALLFTPANRPRIRSINVGLAAYGAPTLLAPFLTGDFPRLQTLTVDCREPQWYEVDQEDADLHSSTVTVRRLEIQHAPELTRAVLNNCLLPWTANVFSQLTHLEIRVNGGDNFIADDLLPTHQQLQTVITSMVALEELYLDIFPEYDDVNQEQPPIALSPSCQQITLRGRDAFLNRHCYRLAASLVVPPHAKLIVKQASTDDADLIVNHFAGPQHPPQALSLRTGLDLEHTSMGEVIIPFDPALWLATPANLLTATPGGHISLQFLFDFGEDGEGEDEENCYNSLFRALSRIDYGQLRVVRIAGLREEQDIERLLFGGENDGDLEEVNVLSGAANLDVLVATFDDDDLGQQFLDVVAAPGQPMFPLLQTVHQ